MTHRTFLSRRLARNEDGMAAVEFALVAPVFLTMLMGIFDLGQMGYGMAVLNGAIQKAGRANSLETATTADADRYVVSSLSPVFPDARVTQSRVSYFDFNDIGRPESWNDANNNSVCDNGESYIDENGNGSWDRDIGRNGNGGASDVVIYTVTVQYTSLFKVPFMPDNWGTRTLTASSVKKNQPFGAQAAYATTGGGTCT